MTLPIRTLLELHAAFAALDGHPQVITDGATEKVVLKPYTFSGKTRWNIAKNLTLLKRVNEDFVKARDDLINQLSNGAGTIDETDTAAIKTMNAELKTIMDTEEDVPGLLMIDLEGLNLDANPIAGSVLSVLSVVVTEKAAA